MKPWRNVVGYRIESRGGATVAVVNKLDCGHEIAFGGGAEIIAKARVAEKRRCFHCPDVTPQPKGKRRNAPRAYLIDRDLI